MSQISSNENWKSVLNLLQQELDQSSFDSWIKPIKFLEVNGNILKLLVPSLFLKNWISLNYKDSIFINAKNIFTDIVWFTENSGNSSSSMWRGRVRRVIGSLEIFNSWRA